MAWGGALIVTDSHYKSRPGQTRVIHVRANLVVGRLLLTEPARGRWERSVDILTQDLTLLEIESEIVMTVYQKTAIDGRADKVGTLPSLPYSYDHACMLLPRL